MTHKEQIISILESAGFKRVETIEKHKKYSVSTNKIVAQCRFNRIVYVFDDEDKCINITTR